MIDMPEGILKFNLPEEEDAFKVAREAYQYKLVIERFRKYLLLEEEEDVDYPYSDIIERMRLRLDDICEECDVFLEPY